MSARVAFGIAALVCACRTSSSDTASSKGNAAPVTSKGSVASSNAVDVTWTVPSAWSTEPNATGMRKATYKVARAAGDGDDATVSVIQAGGTVDANVERWYGQFNNVHDQKRNELRVGPLKVTVVEAHGTYTGGGVMVGESPNPKPGWALLGAIVETSPQPYFFKMLGPDKTVSSAQADFQALINSLKPK